MGVHLIVGLGNPGPKYAGHRHNIGFLVADELADQWGAPGFREKFQGEYTKVSLGEQDVIILKPLTYMNLSGESVQPAMHFFRVPLERVICIHDELDLPFGEVRLKVGGGTAGHNGLKSLVQQCGGPDFVRCRMGIGRPADKRPAHAYVLSDFSPEEAPRLTETIDQAVAMLREVVVEGPIHAMNRFHGA